MPSSNSSDNPEPQTTRKASKRAYACVHCKSLKVRCEFLADQGICKRCLEGEFECVPRTRKKRKPAPSHEELQERTFEQDRQIAALLAQWDKMRLSGRVRQLVSESGNYFSLSPPFPLNEPTTQTHGKRRALRRKLLQSLISLEGELPGLLRRRLCQDYFWGRYPQLTDILSRYFERVNPYFCLLDPALYSDPSELIWSSPFLFTAMCAVASRYDVAHPELSPQAYAFARNAAATALTDGSIGLDVCQAYMLLAVYPPPHKRWADERTWVFMGISIRMAIELKLDQPPQSIHDTRQCLNRTRTWLHCFCGDAFYAIQQGKLPMLSLDDYLARNSAEWYRLSDVPYDIYLCACIRILLRAAEWRVHRYENENDLVPFCLKADAEICAITDFWTTVFVQVRGVQPPNSVHVFRATNLQLVAAYIRLAILGDAFQHAPKETITADAEILHRALASAREVIDIALEQSRVGPHFPNTMDSHWLFLSFATAFLINLLRPRFEHLLFSETRQEILRLAKEVIAATEQVAVNAKHAPALYSRFLSSLLKNRDAFYVEGRDPRPPDVFEWSNVAPSTPIETGVDELLFQRDFTLDYFLQSINWQESNWEQPYYM
ncbi:Zn(2)-C6 fungal-type domain-containing protein [Mycena chlorophos]|uniref:Zn(2)-C6 fungal-type domain-containing protein n=1 Tax=Mycena chlorophos TaxID=658473 RepID=A0A8H6TUD5_MYCCL|nr:Zn(2)-C6 fungal-type domain-containing protein [Mycena chlorophos]